MKRHNLLKFTQREIDNLNRPISIEETESVVINLRLKVPSTNDFTGEFNQTYKEQKNKDKFSILSTRKQKQRKYYQTHFMSAALS